MTQQFHRTQTDASIDDCQLRRPERNHYFHGKLMAARDMAAEQRYNRALVTRQHRYVTGFGVVTGLQASISRAEDDLDVTIEPGTAIDCCGRPIVVPSETTIRIPEDEVPTANEYALWIFYDECVTESVPIPGRETTDERDCAYNRVIESFTLDVTAINEVDGGMKPVPPVAFPESSDQPSGDIDLESEVATLIEGRDLETVSLERERDIEAIRARKMSLETSIEETLDLESIAATWDDAGPEDLPVGCGSHESHAVLLGTFSEPGGNEAELNTEVRPRVYSNDLLYSAIAHHTADFGNPHEVNARQVGALASVNGVSNAGGDVDFRSEDISFESIAEGDDRAVEFAVPELETINDRIDGHLEDDENPHDVTAVQTGAIERIRGVVTNNGNIEFASEEIEFEHETPGNEDPVIEFNIPSLPELRGRVDDHAADTSNPHDVTAEQTGGIGSINGVEHPGGDIAFTSEDIEFDRTDGATPGVVFDIPRLGDLADNLEEHLEDTDNPHEVDVEEGGGLARINGVDHGEGNIEFVSLTEQAQFVTDQRRVDEHQVGLDITGFDEVVDRLDRMTEELDRVTDAIEERDAYLAERSIRSMAKEYESAERRYDLQLGQTVSKQAVNFISAELDDGEGVRPDHYVHFLDGSLSSQAEFYDDLEETGIVSPGQLDISRRALEFLEQHIREWEGDSLFPIAQAQIRVAELLDSLQDPPRIE